ncbi:MAG TPA: FAD:protein FMN transferase [Candidatus Limnocylindria bacterium]|nr:FAD:protein FMN transferase [Candidatus Limnocylindria bacterium]
MTPIVSLLACLLAAEPTPGAGELSTIVRVERGRYLMGTLCTAEAEGADTTEVAAALGAALDEMARLERVTSNWDSVSDVSSLNQLSGDSYACSPDLFAVLDSALVLARLTGGAFDPTIEPLTRVWDLRGAGRVPHPDSLEAARSLVGWQTMELERPTRTTRLAVRGAGVDLGGIGKGFALARAAGVLQARGIRRARLNLGGEVLVLSEGRPWTVTIAHPARRLEPALSLELANGAISTSGQSERGFERAGVRYGHVLDPASGRPVMTAASVTVIGPSATRTDAISTALLVMGRERAGQFARLHPELGVLWLEPVANEVRAWKWNWDVATAVPAANVKWIDTPNTRTSPR